MNKVFFIVLLILASVMQISCNKLDISNESEKELADEFSNLSIMPERFEQFGSGQLSERSQKAILLDMELGAVYTIRLKNNKNSFENIYANLYDERGKWVASNYAITAKKEMKFHDAWIYRSNNKGQFKLILSTQDSDLDIIYALGKLKAQKVVN